MSTWILPTSVWQEVPEITENIYEKNLFDMYFHSIVQSMSHPLTWRSFCPILQPATRWQTRWFGFKRDLLEKVQAQVMSENSFWMTLLHD